MSDTEQALSDIELYFIGFCYFVRKYYRMTNGKEMTYEEFLPFMNGWLSSKEASASFRLCKPFDREEFRKRTGGHEPPQSWYEEEWDIK